MACGCGCGSSNNCSRGIALAGAQALGLNGQSIYGYQAYADDAAGTGFSLTYTGTQTYRAILLSPVILTTLLVTNFTGLFQKWTGDDGIPGAISRQWDFDTATGSADPTAGKVRLNNSDSTLATAIYVSKTDNAALAVGPMLALAGLSTMAIKSYVQVTKKTDNSKFALYSVSALTDNGAWDTLAVNYVTGSGGSPLLLNDDVVLSISLPGPAGRTGVTILHNDLSRPASAGSGGNEILNTYSIPGGTLANNGDRINIEARFQNWNPNIANGMHGTATDIEVAFLAVESTILFSMSSIIEFWGYGVGQPEKVIKVSINRIDSTSYLITGALSSPDYTGFVFTDSIVVTGVNFANPIVINPTVLDTIVTTPFVAGVTMSQLYVEYISA